jgi:hypothetical protein
VSGQRGEAGWKCDSVRQEGLGRFCRHGRAGRQTSRHADRTWKWGGLVGGKASPAGRNTWSARQASSRTRLAVTQRQASKLGDTETQIQADRQAGRQGDWEGEVGQSRITGRGSQAEQGRVGTVIQGGRAGRCSVGRGRLAGRGTGK